MRYNDTLDANNVAADSSCNDAAKCTNGSILKGHCWFSDGYDSFDLTEDLYENSDGSFDLKAGLGADGNFTYWKSTVPEGWDSWTKEEKTAYTTGMDYVGSEEKPKEYASWTDAEKAAFAKAATKFKHAFGGIKF